MTAAHNEGVRAVRVDSATDAHAMIQGRGIRMAAMHLVPARYFPNGIDPQAYACKLVGDCLEPHVHEDDMAIVAPSFELMANTFCVLWLKGADPIVKRYVGRYGTAYHLVEMFNPRRLFQVHRDQLDAVHPIVHIARPAEYESWPPALPPADRRPA